MSKERSLECKFPRMARNTSTAIHNVFGLARSLLFDQRYFWTLAVLVIIGDAVLTELIIRVIPCKHLRACNLAAYSLHRPGRHRNRLGDLYGSDTAIYQGTTQLYPNIWSNWTFGVRAVLHDSNLVLYVFRYPAGHVRIHEWLYNLTDAGRNIRLAQHIYGVLYILTLATTCGIYRKAGNIPNWVVLLLPLSKRLHSIFVLRLFNDCWAVFLMSLAVLALQNNIDDTAILLYRCVVLLGVF